MDPIYLGNSKIAKKHQVTRFVHIETIDLDIKQAGGVESLVRDTLDFGDLDWQLIGVTRNPKQKNLGQNRSYSTSTNKVIPWVAVSSFRVKKFTPDSFRLCIGLLRHSSALSGKKTFLAHRVEVGLLLRMMKVNFILVLHNNSTGLLAKSSESLWRRVPKLFNLTSRFACKGAKAIVVFNSTEAEKLKAWNENTFSMMSWFDSSVFYLPDRGSSLTRKFNSPIQLTWIGRLESQKNPILALKIAENLAGAGIEVKLDVIGSGSLLRQVELYVSENNLGSVVTLHGLKNREYVAEELRKSDCLLVTSYSEGSSLVIAEAAALGVPTIVHEAADTDSFIVDGVNGFRAQTHEPQNYVQKILKLNSISRQEVELHSRSRSRDKLLPEFEAIISRFAIPS